MRVRHLVPTMMISVAWITTVASAQCLYQLDDGDGTGSVGPSSDASIIVLNGFTVGEALSSIYAVQACWHPAVSGEQMVTAGVWADPDQDGDPSDGVLLGTSVPALSTGPGCQTFALQSPVDVGPDGTSFFVGVYWQDIGPNLGILVDFDFPNHDSSFAVFQSGAPDPNSLSMVNTFEDFLIRGLCDGVVAVESARWGRVKAAYED